MSWSPGKMLLLTGVTLVCVPESHDHVQPLPEHHAPLAPELPLTDSTADEALDLKTQLTRFVLTGGFSAIVDYGLYVLLMALGVTRDVAKALSFVAGTTTAYLINRRWTFKAPPSRVRFAAVVVLYAVTFAAQVGINRVLNEALGDEWWVTPFAFVVAQGTATVINFVVQRVVIFRLR
ncbi:GtrA family protein [Rhodococcus sp. 852002-51564_SCH6189132-a]|uniref:GtrA family protein n=1 Tax=Rhodococcus sp. 852002-51564_SCH6189132-a TaxID=1834103 RepID=UPI001E2CBAB2|nr:GtrA family protein [Rhodococcus sp. 852002-51564_SCH6189132-a]